MKIPPRSKGPVLIVALGLLAAAGLYVRSVLIATTAVTLAGGTLQWDDPWTVGARPVRPADVAAIEILRFAPDGGPAEAEVRVQGRQGPLRLVAGRGGSPGVIPALDALAGAAPVALSREATAELSRRVSQAYRTLDDPDAFEPVFRAGRAATAYLAGRAREARSEGTPSGDLLASELDLVASRLGPTGSFAPGPGAWEPVRQDLDRLIHQVMEGERLFPRIRDNHEVAAVLGLVDLLRSPIRDLRRRAAAELVRAVSSPSRPAVSSVPPDVEDTAEWEALVRQWEGWRRDVGAQVHYSSQYGVFHVAPTPDLPFLYLRSLVTLGADPEAVCSLAAFLRTAEPVLRTEAARILAELVDHPEAPRREILPGPVDGEGWRKLAEEWALWCEDLGAELSWDPERRRWVVR